MTIKEFIKNASEMLKEAKIETPALEVGVILCHALNCDRAYLYSHDDRLLKESELAELNSVIKRRCEKEPLQYILGETEFMSLDFRVTPAVLIPRQDTEVLVEKCIELVKNLNSSPKKALPYAVDSSDTCSGSTETGQQMVKVLDICTGSGCIAVSIAYYCPQSEVVACDISGDALAIAKINAEKAGVHSRMCFRQGDLFSALDGGQRFQLIVSNPPYIESETVLQLDSQVRQHEPVIALDGGADGLDFYRKIIDTAPDFLVDKGYLALEIGYNQSEGVKSLMETSFEQVTVLKDYGRNDRVVFGIKKMYG